MNRKYVCVHCMKERGNGCRCVSPFADNEILADMRRERKFEMLNRMLPGFTKMIDSMIISGDYSNELIPRLLPPFSRMRDIQLRKAFVTPIKSALKPDIGSPPEHQGGGLMKPFRVTHYSSGIKIQADLISSFPDRWRW